ncbi:MAG: hypothetical protein PHQ43_15910, partial [Dehalococcoidales bacterium]|nr:hypothetical protein [Dehalococcoidales bacterium]
KKMPELKTGKPALVAPALTRGTRVTMPNYTTLSNRAERTPEAVAVSEHTREAGELSLSPDSPTAPRSSSGLASARLAKSPKVDRLAGEVTASSLVTPFLGDSRTNLVNSLPGTLISDFPPYLDVGDNVHANVDVWLEANCGDSESQWFIPGTCSNGHRIAKVIACGKEWCPVCGEKGSIAHNRRFVRWLPKITQFKQMRYVVLTIPESLRSQYRTKAALTKVGRQAQDLLKSLGYTRGLRRWHWFGDRSHKWHPHLNILVEGGYMPAPVLAALKAGWAYILGADVVDVRVQYKKRPGDMTGCLHYVTRATFRDYEWDIDMAKELKGFRNMVVWGQVAIDKVTEEPISWAGIPWAPVWQPDSDGRKTAAGEALDVEAIEHIVEGTCPKCGAAIEWGHSLPGSLLERMSTEAYGAGYFNIVLNGHKVVRRLPTGDRLASLRAAAVARELARKQYKPVYLNEPGWFETPCQN